MTSIKRNDSEGEFHPMTIYVRIPAYEKARKYAYDHHDKIKKVVEKIVHKGIKELKP